MLAAMAFAGAWLAASCNGSLEPVKPAPQVQPASFALCQAAAGSTLQELGVQQGSPFNLVTANGNLYYALGNGNSSTEAIMALPLSGGSPVTLAMAEGYQLWLDGQAVNTAAVNDRLWRVPFGGGDATLIADGNTTGPPNYNVATAQAFDGTNFYWDLRPQNGMPFWNVWQISIAGGVAQKLADLPIPPGPNVNWTMLETSAYGVLIAYENFPQVGAYLVPPGGGTPQVLPSPPLVGSHADNGLLGTSPTEVLWKTAGVDPVTGGNLITLRLTHVAGPGRPTVREFWPDHPANFTPYGVSSRSGADDGSWLISGFEPFDDGATHGSLWLVDADGNGSRIGCDPNVGYVPGILTAALATPTAIYAVVGSSAGGLFDYRIVQLSR